MVETISNILITIPIVAIALFINIVGYLLAYESIKRKDYGACIICILLQMLVSGVCLKMFV